VALHGESYSPSTDHCAHNKIRKEMPLAGIFQTNSAAGFKPATIGF
jgi:hypothetical protein